MTKIICNSFVKRQTPDSSFSHFAGSWEALEGLAELNFEHAKPGYKPGILLIPVPAERFFSGVVTVTEGTTFETTFKARREGEQPFIDVVAKGPKTQAVVVNIVVYTKEALEGDASAIPADYEIVSINAQTSEAPEPMTPMAMARNFLGLPGGSKAEYTAEQFAEAIMFWSKHAMRGA